VKLARKGEKDACVEAAAAGARCLRNPALPARAHAPRTGNTSASRSSRYLLPSSLPPSPSFFALSGTLNCRRGHILRPMNKREQLEGNVQSARRRLYSPSKCLRTSSSVASFGSPCTNTA